MGRRLRFGAFFEKVFYGGTPSGSRLPGKEQIKAVHMHAKPEIYGFKGALLADGTFQFRNILGSFEFKLALVANPS
jgi:hypothetical protein